MVFGFGGSAETWGDEIAVGDLEIAGELFARPGRVCGIDHQCDSGRDAKRGAGESGGDGNGRRADAHLARFKEGCGEEPDSVAAGGFDSVQIFGEGSVARSREPSI